MVVHGNTPQRVATAGRLAAFGAIAILFASPASARSAGALMLMDRGLAAHAQDRILEVVRAQMLRIHRVVPASTVLTLAQRRPECEPGSSRGAEALANAREGISAFFEQTDLLRATRLLEQAVSSFLDRPCILRGDEAAIQDLCAGGALLVRLYLLQGRGDEAQRLARRLTRALPVERLAATGEPPEVLGLFTSPREEVRDVDGTAGPEDRAAGATWLAGAVSSAQGARARIQFVGPGPHVVALLTRDGRAYEWSGTLDGPHLSLDLELAERVQPGPSGSLQPALETEQPDRLLDTARLVASITHHTVLLVQSDPQWVRVEEVAPDRDHPRELLRLRPVEEPRDGIEVVVEPGGPLLTRPAWPWPYLAAGVSVSFLGAGVALNILANRDAKAVNDGENRVSEYRTRRAWAIASYSAAGVSAGAAVVLFLLRPDPTERFIVFGTGPGGGGGVSLSGSF